MLLNCSSWTSPCLYRRLPILERSDTLQTWPIAVPKHCIDTALKRQFKAVPTSKDLSEDAKMNVTPLKCEVLYQICVLNSFKLATGICCKTLYVSIDMLCTNWKVL